MLQGPQSSLVDSPVLQVCNGFQVRKLRWTRQKLDSVTIELFCVDLNVCFGSFVLLEYSSYNFLAEAARVSFNLLILRGVHGAMYANKFPRAFGERQGKKT